MYEVFFLSYDEENADRAWQGFQARVKRSKRISGIEGIMAAHAEASNRSRTPHFFVVDCDCSVIDYTVFDYIIPEWDRDYVHLWNSRNPLNGLEYGWGGIKLFPKGIFGDTMPLDMTTSYPLKIMDKVASVSMFNMSEFETWRSAFREAVKLSVATDEESKERLKTWTTYASGKYQEECLRGARDGVSHVEEGRDPNLINDYEWLKKRFS